MDSGELQFRQKMFFAIHDDHNGNVYNFRSVVVCRTVGSVVA